MHQPIKVPMAMFFFSILNILIPLRYISLSDKGNKDFGLITSLATLGKIKHRLVTLNPKSFYLSGSITLDLSINTSRK